MAQTDSEPDLTTPVAEVLPKVAVEILQSKLTTVFLPILYIIVFAVALPTNALAIWVFLFNKKHPTAIYMVNLALSDLLFVIWIPLKISYHFRGNNWVYGEGLCKVLVGFFYGNMYCSIMFITCISVQRYVAVAHPMSVQIKNNRIASAVSVMVWIIIWTLTTPLYLYDQTVLISELNITTCHDVTKLSDKQLAVSFSLPVGVIGFVIPSIVCVVFYILMMRALKNSTTNENIWRRRKKIIPLIVSVVVLFLVCFTPSNIMLFIYQGLFLHENDDNVYRVYGFYISTLCLASLNSCVDPFIYYFIYEEFRVHLRNTFRRRGAEADSRTTVRFRAVN